ncbi:MAG: OmpA family protein [Deltaproteobacteria bacterium]|jgi:peptidoglycan-associated lipoprotein|nr:OmpA family protein [Deltaproteobacteria bacterium]
MKIRPRLLCALAALCGMAGAGGCAASGGDFSFPPPTPQITPSPYLEEPAEAGGQSAVHDFSGAAYGLGGDPAYGEDEVWAPEEAEAASFIHAAKIYFYFDSADLTEEAREVLRQKAAILLEKRQFSVTVTGHADERGTEDYNLALGERRARAALEYMISLGVPADRLRALSLGKKFPLVGGKGESAWSQNRRDEFFVRKMP